MPTTLRRKSDFDFAHTFKAHIEAKLIGATFVTRSDNLKKRLKDWIAEKPDGSYSNENGSVFVDLPETVQVQGKSFKGFELRHGTKTVFDEAEAEKILKRRTKKDPKILTDAQSSYIDQDKIYRLVEEGRLTEEELDKMMPSADTWAFWPTEGEVL